MEIRFVQSVVQPVVNYFNNVPILSSIVFQVVMAGKYVCRHRDEWKFLQFFCLNQLVILMGKYNVSLGL
jgi:hypothetical protein